MVSAVSKIANREGMKRISEVNIRIGELQQIDLEIFELALSEVARPLWGEIRFNVEFEKAGFKCRACGTEWPFDPGNLDADVKEAIHVIPEVAHAFLKCPKCGSSDFEIDKGRGIWVEGVKGER